MLRGFFRNSFGVSTGILSEFFYKLVQEFFRSFFPGIPLNFLNESSRNSFGVLPKNYFFNKSFGVFPKIPLEVLHEFFQGSSGMSFGALPSDNSFIFSSRFFQKFLKSSSKNSSLVHSGSYLRISSDFHWEMLQSSSGKSSSVYLGILPEFL